MNARCCTGMLAVLLAVACSPPITVKRTALVPTAYLPARTGSPLNDMEVRIQGEANPVRLSNGKDPISTYEYERVHFGEAGLLIPQAAIGGSAYFAPVRYIEFGGHFYWSSYKWARANNQGVLDFPEDRKVDVWRGGVGLRGNIPITWIDLTISFLFQLDFTKIPEAEFVDQSRGNPFGSYVKDFQFNRIYESTWVYPGAFLQIDKGFLDSTLHLYIILGIERALSNIGFDSKVRNQSTLESAAAIPFGIGLEYKYEWFVVGATFFYPVALGDGLDAGTFGPSLSLSLGVVLGGVEGGILKKEPVNTDWADWIGEETP